MAVNRPSPKAQPKDKWQNWNHAQEVSYHPSHAQLLAQVPAQLATIRLALSSVTSPSRHRSFDYVAMAQRMSPVLLLPIHICIIHVHAVKHDLRDEFMSHIFPCTPQGGKLY